MKTLISLLRLLNLLQVRLKTCLLSPFLLEHKKTSVETNNKGHVSKQTSETEVSFIDLKDIFLFAKEYRSNYIKGYDENCSEIQQEFRGKLGNLKNSLPDRVFFQATRDMIINLKYCKKAEIQNEQLILHFNVKNLEDFLQKREGQHQENIFNGN